MTLLWGSGSPPCWRVQVALEEKQVKGYKDKLLSFEKMEHKSQEVMEMNPRGQVSASPVFLSLSFDVSFQYDAFCLQLPAFKWGDKVLNESYAACLFLEVRASAKIFMLSRKS